MRVLIADDEMLVRAGLRSTLDWEKHGFTVIGEADQGEKTLHMLEEFRPDILLLDINMPMMNGIDVLKEMRNRKTLCKVIVLSCHDEFEYVKEAMRYGAVEYILKHKISSDSILHVLMEVKNEIEQEDQHNAIHPSARKLDREAIYMRNEFLQQLLRGNRLSDWEIERYMEQGIRIKERNMFCLLFEVERYREVLQRYGVYEQELLEFSIENMSKELLNSVEECEYFTVRQNVFMILLSHAHDSSEHNMFQRCTSILHKVQSALHKYLNIRTTFAISERFDRFADVGKMVHQTSRALSQKFIQPDRTIFYVKDMDFAANPLFEELLRAENEVFNYLIDHDFADAFHLIHSKLEQVMATRYVDIKRFKDFLRRMFFVMKNKFLADNYEEFELQEWYSMNDVYQSMQVMKHWYSNAVVVSNSTMNYLVREALAFINQHIATSISLKSISSVLGVSESHISRLFNKEMNMSVLQYVNTQRIEKAKNLLHKTVLKNYEIAEAVGFNSQVHFDIVFKKLMGCTPTEYRNRQ